MSPANNPLIAAERMTNPNALQLLIIDPQNDFCDLPPAWCPTVPGAQAQFLAQSLAPALPVAGAHADMLRLAGLIDTLGHRLDGITITLDSHPLLDIGHPPFWITADGQEPAAFTPVTADDVTAGRLLPRWPGAVAQVVRYLQALEAAGRYTHMIWPVHCETGSWGQGVHPAVLASADRWERAQALRGARVTRVLKGLNPWTEHYSALQAEVPDPQDPDTQLNQTLITQLARAHTLLVAGEASSHCVRATVEHLVANLPPADGQNRWLLPQNIVLLTDCMSPVTEFEASQQAFFEQMQAQGLRLAGSVDIVMELRV